MRVCALAHASRGALQNPNTEEDVDVVAERQRVFNARNDARNGISIRGLVKVCGYEVLVAVRCVGSLWRDCCACRRSSGPAMHQSTQCGA